MCVVQCSQKQKREREKENATTRKECSRYYLVLLYVRLSLVDLFFSRVHRALFEETLKAFLWRCDEVLFFLLLCVSFFKIFSRICLMLMRLKKNDSLTKKKEIRLLLLKKDIEKRCECEICRNEKQRRRIRRVVLNRGVLRGSTREEEDVTMRVKGLIVAYGRRT